MTESQLTILIRKYLSGEATEEERKQIEQWYESFNAYQAEFADRSPKKVNESTVRSLKAIKEKITLSEPINEVERRSVKPKKRNFPGLRIAAAAAVLMFLATGTLYFLSTKRNKQQPDIAVQHNKNDLQPGGNKAILTLGNGRTIVLDSTNNGLLSMQGNTKIIKLSNGQLTYNSKTTNNKQQTTDNRQQTTVQYNTITTPRGGQYEILLPDGSKIWLNAASSIRFPTAFTGQEREVQITGEAYFEVAKNVSQPFKVSVRGMTVNVLGTHFNIMAYTSETSIKTTLLEGTVKVLKGDKALLLKQGQEVEVMPNGKMELIKAVNLDAIVAWKNNLFWFDNSDIQSVMRQLSRWYDVDIMIEGNIPDLFTGSIPRNLTFSKVFEVLQQTGSIHYKIEDRKIIVSP